MIPSMTDDAENDVAKLREEILAAVRDEAAFLRLTFSDAPAECEWERVALRPVEIRGRRAFQAAYFAGKRHITKNVAADEIASAIDALAALSFARVHVQSAAGDLHARLTRKGRLLISRGKPSRSEAAPRLETDHVKTYLLPQDKPDAFLREIGIMNEAGKVRPGMFPKFRQINEFLRVIQQAAAGRPAGEPVRLIDCGCGSAQLTFAAFHYLRHVLGLEASAVGVDVNAALIDKCRALRDKLGWGDLDFVAASIADYAPAQPPHMVVSLHACDTATDEALARGVQWGSQTILAAPCCQHELHNQIDQPAFRAVLRHGLLRERQADILTDALRAAALRAVGYHARVFEFISPEHTGKNLMIAAERIVGADPGQAAAAREYIELKRFWNVTPAIERALGAVLAESLAETGA